MYFDEGRILKQLQKSKTSKNRGQNITKNQANSNSRSQSGDAAPSSTREVSSSWDIKTASILDSANNKLQELMQILYLLSRDPGVPKEARYHVTVAQGEIALLARVIRNTTEASGEKLAGMRGLNLRPAHP